MKSKYKTAALPRVPASGPIRQMLDSTGRRVWATELPPGYEPGIIHLGPHKVRAKVLNVGFRLRLRMGDRIDSVLQWLEEELAKPWKPLARRNALVLELVRPYQQADLKVKTATAENVLRSYLHVVWTLGRARLGSAEPAPTVFSVDPADHPDLADVSLEILAPASAAQDYQRVCCAPHPMGTLEYDQAARVSADQVRLARRMF